MSNLSCSNCLCHNCLNSECTSGCFACCDGLGLPGLDYQFTSECDRYIAPDTTGLVCDLED